MISSANLAQIWAMIYLEQTNSWKEVLQDGFVFSQESSQKKRLLLPKIRPEN